MNPDNYEFIWAPELKIRGIFKDNSTDRECHLIVFDNNRGEVTSEKLWGCDLMAIVREKKQ